MQFEEGEKLNRIERLKSKLFSKDYQTKIEHRETFTRSMPKAVPETWEGVKKAGTNFSEKFFMRTSIFKKFFLASVCLFGFALIYLLYTLFIGGNTVSNNNIDIAIIGSSFTAGGEELPLQIEITNRNNSPLELVDLVVEYPKGTEGELPVEMERLRESLGSIPAGSVRSENMRLILFGEQGSSREIRVAIEYRVEGSNAIFVKEKFYDVTISSTPTNIAIDAPRQVSPNQELPINIKIEQNATRSAPNMLLRVDYPSGFQFVSSKPTPSFGNNVWNLGDLAPGAEMEIELVGRMVDVFDGEEKNFRISSGSQSSANKYQIDVVFNSLNHTVTVNKPFIEAQLYVNGQYEKEYAIDSKTPVRGEIRYLNNLDTQINDLEIRAKVSGNAFDERSINPEQGRYDSIRGEMIWDSSTINRLRELDPGDSGEVSFSIAPLSALSASGSVLSDPSVKIEVSISGQQPLEGDAVETITNGETKTIRLLSEVGFAGKAVYYYGPFKNTGPIPPKAETETTYTIIWTLSNTANNLSNARVLATLPPWVRFVGPVAPQSEDLTYNSSTKEILWDIGSIPKGTGISRPGREVAFQVALLPSLSQVGQTPTLINDAVLTGRDDFANISIRVNKASLNTRLSNDPTFPTGGDRVVE